MAILLFCAALSVPVAGLALVRLAERIGASRKLKLAAGLCGLIGMAAALALIYGLLLGWEPGVRIGGPGLIFSALGMTVVALLLAFGRKKS